MKLPYLIDTNNKPSASLTLAILSYAIVSLWLIAWLIGSTINLPVPQFDVGAAMGYLAPILALYFGRRHTQSKETTND